MTKTVYSVFKFITATAVLSAALLFSNQAKSQTSVSALTADSLCVGDTIKLIASFSGSSSATFAWSDTTGASSLNPSTGDTISVYPTTTTHYRIIGDTNGTKDTVYFTVKVNALPTVSITLKSATICKGDTAVMYGSGAATYKWFDDPSVNTPFATGDTAMHVPKTSKTYIVEGTDANGCKNKSNASLQLNNGPNELIDAFVDGFKTNNLTCRSSRVELKARTGSNTYKWSSSNLSLTNTSGATTSFVADTANSTTVTCLITGSNGCSTKWEKSYLVIQNRLKINLAWKSDSAFCDMDSALVEASIGPDASNTQFRWGPDSIVSPDTIRNSSNIIVGHHARIHPHKSNTITVKGFENGCIVDSTLDVTVYPAADLSLSKSSTTPVCKDEADTITAISNRGVKFDWGYGVISNSKVKAIAPGKTSFVTVKAFTANNCTAIDSIKIDVDTTCGGNLSTQEIAASEVKIYKSQNNLRIEFGNTPDNDNVSVQLINLTGQVSKSENLGQVEIKDEKEIDISELNSGIYLVRVIGSDYEVVQKFLK